MYEWSWSPVSYLPQIYSIYKYIIHISTIYIYMHQVHSQLHRVGCWMVETSFSWITWGFISESFRFSNLWHRIKVWMIPKSEQQRFRWCISMKSWGKHHKNFWGQTCIPKNYFRKSLNNLWNNNITFFRISSYFFVEKFSLADPHPNTRQPVPVTAWGKQPFPLRVDVDHR